jgi:hypothetical protein
MGPRPHTQVDVCLGNIKSLEKRPGHIVIIVLPGMDQHMFYSLTAQNIMIFNRPDERSYFHKIGAGTDYGKYFHGKKRF